MDQEKSKSVNEPIEPRAAPSAGRVISLDRNGQIAEDTGHANSKLERAALEEAEGEEVERDLGMD